MQFELSREDQELVREQLATKYNGPEGRLLLTNVALFWGITPEKTAARTLEKILKWTR